ncbi:MAG: hypothetical protein K6G86_00720 [Bacteroidales bacterium]|nr:hypothetical protein [Bacteroidales bacterium]
MAYKKQFEEESTCLECGKAFYGRKDKHFCSLSCKNMWHNRKIRERRHLRMEVMAALARNYEILNALLKEERVSAELEELVKAGYDPAFVTGHRKGLYRHDEYTCFDISFYRTSTKIFNVRRKACDGH